jgi:hypothetical protein
VQANARISIPSDLAGIAYVQYDSRSVKSDTFEFKLRSHLKSVLFSSLQKKPPSSFNIHLSEVRNFRKSIDSLIREDKITRGRNFEQLIYDIARDVIGWDVVARPHGSEDASYDLAIWNEINDPILSALGNPIMLEAKASKIDLGQISRLIRFAKKSGLRSFVLVTLDELSNSISREIENLQKREHIIPIILSRDDILKIEIASDLVKLIRTKASTIIYSGGSSV